MVKVRHVFFISQPLILLPKPWEPGWLKGCLQRAKGLGMTGTNSKRTFQSEPTLSGAITEY